MRKKILSLIFTVLLVFAMLPIGIFAESTGYLSELAFGSTTATANKGNCTLAPVFDPDVHEYTVYVDDSATALSAWATLSGAGSGKTITCKYTKTTGAAGSVALTSGKATGQSLAQLIAAGNKENTLTIEVGDQNYTVNVKRKATLNELALVLGDSVLDMTPVFAGTTFEYSAFAPKADKIKVNAVKKDDNAVLTINGFAPGEAVDLIWNGNKAEIKIEVSYGSEATRNTYIVTLNAISGLEGNGTKDDPYLIKNADDMVTLSNLVKSGVSFKGLFINLKADVTLPKGWTPIGDLTDAAKLKYTDYTTTIKVKDSYPFKGTFDGEGHTITVPSGELTAFGSVFHATLRNFNIYGEKIPGYGVVQYWLQRSSPKDIDNNEVIIENVKLLSGTHTMMSGFIGGYESGMDRVNIRNCEVEKGVYVGNDGKGFWKDYENSDPIKGAYAYGPADTTMAGSGRVPLITEIHQNDFVGSFVGAASGEIVNCKSSATVYGKNFVGGIWGFKGQSMGDCLVRDCYFDGNVIAEGKCAGGILGSGYASPSAPNTPCVTVQNCSSYGTISAADYVGGITGGEILMKQNWNNGVGYIQNNFFGGKIITLGSNNGAIIGYFNVLDNCNIISNNFYLEGCGADKGLTLNAVETVANYVPAYEIKAGDDPESFCKKVTSESDALDALNKGVNSSTTWKIEGGKLVSGSEKHIVSIFNPTISSNPPKSISTFDALDDTVLTVTYNDGTTEEITVADCEKVDWNFLDEAKVKVYKPVQLLYKNVQYAFLLNNTEVIEDPAVVSVDEKAEVLGNITLEKENAVLEVLKEYDALNDSQKAQLKNEDSLLAAKAKLNELKAAKKAEAKKIAEEKAAKKAAEEAEAKKAEEEAAKKAAEEEAAKKAAEEAAKKAAEEAAKKTEEEKKATEQDPSKDSDTASNKVLWICIIAAALIVLLSVVVVRKNKQK